MRGSAYTTVLVSGIASVYKDPYYDRHTTLGTRISMNWEASISHVPFLVPLHFHIPPSLKSRPW